MTNININLKTFIVGAFFIFSIALAYQLRGILLIFFVAFIIFSTLKPIIDALERRRIKRFVAIALVYVLGLSIFTLLFFSIINGVITQVREISLNINLKESNINQFINVNIPFLHNVVDVNSLSKSISDIFDTSKIQALTSGQALTQIVEKLSPVATEGLSFISRFIGGLVSIFMVIILSVYMLIPKKDFYEEFLNLFPKKYSLQITQLLDKIRVKLGAWTLGQLFLMFVIGILTYLIVAIPGLFIDNYGLGKFALIIAIIAGLLEAIPNVGPFLTLVISVILSIATGGGLAIVIYIMAMFILLQQAESLFIVPVVMKRAIDLNPIVSILSVLAGFEIGGPLGALLAVPVVGVLQIILIEFLKNLRKSHD